MAALVMAKTSGAKPNMPSSSTYRSEFEFRLEDIVNLIDDGLLTHEHLCRILKQLIAMTSNSQVRSLWTSLQPLLHRDFMFSGQKFEPEVEFQPVSTALSREIRTHLTKTRNVSRYHRVQSAHLTNEEEVFRVNKLPPIDSKSINESNNKSTSEKMRTHFPKIRQPPKSYETTRSQVRFRTKNKDSDEKVRKRLKLLGEQKYNEIRAKVENLFVWFEEWTNPERSIFYRKVLPKLVMKQLYFLSTYLSVRQNCDFISKLPKNLALKVLRHLSPKDLARAATVSKKWNKLCLSGVLWEEKCDEVRSQIATPSVTSRPGTTRGHYDVYRSNHIRQRNWSRAKCAHAHLEGHDGKVLCVDFNNRVLVSGSADGTIRVWSLRSATTIQVLNGHTKGVWCVAIYTACLVISGSYDRTIKVWNIKNGMCLRTLYGHTGAVWALACKDHLVATGSNDKTIKLWDMRHCKLKHTYNGHSKPVFAVDIAHDLSMLFSGAADHSVRIWDTMDGKSLRIIWASNSAPIMSLSYAGGLLAYAADNLLNIWDVKNETNIRTYKGHKDRVETLKLSVKEKDGDRMVSLLSAGRDGKVKHWRFGKKDPVKTMVAHKDCQVNCIAFDKKRLVTALYDNSICICDFSVTEEVDKHLKV
ncbi:uncharacterized protein LOC120332685 [Styela clava]